MRVLIAAFCAIAAVSAYDAVYFSNDRNIKNSNIDEIVKSASAESPVVVIVNPDFTLGQFSVKANAYSGEPADDYLVKSVKNSKFHGAFNLPKQVNADGAQFITSADQYKEGSAVYVIAGEEWTTMNALAEQLLAKINSPVAIISSSESVAHEQTRVKRVATDEMEGVSDDQEGNQVVNNVPLPLILPPFNQSGYDKFVLKNSKCLFYLEGLDVVVFDMSKKEATAVLSVVDGNATWSANEGDFACPEEIFEDNKPAARSYVFRVRLTLTGDITSNDNDKKYTLVKGDTVDMSLNFTRDVRYYWQLSGATLHKLELSGSDKISVNEATISEYETQASGLAASLGWSVTCGQTEPIFFPTSDKGSVYVGIALLNTQVQLYNNFSTNYNETIFTYQTVDCVSTFSTGSWMGIVSSLVLIAGLLFGYVMLQSVQTQDRYDDPKQKQIVINVRE